MYTRQPAMCAPQVRTARLATGDRLARWARRYTPWTLTKPAISPSAKAARSHLDLRSTPTGFQIAFQSYDGPSQRRGVRSAPHQTRSGAGCIANIDKAGPTWTVHPGAGACPGSQPRPPLPTQGPGGPAWRPRHPGGRARAIAGSASSAPLSCPTGPAPRATGPGAAQLAQGAAGGRGREPGAAGAECDDVGGAAAPRRSGARARAGCRRRGRRRAGKIITPLYILYSIFSTVMHGTQ